MVVSLIALPLSAFSQLTIQAPAASSTVASCDEYFTDRLANPVDMSDTADVNYFVTGHDVYALSNVSWSSGLFSFTTSSANQAIFYLFSPDICNFISATGGARWGSKLPLMDSSVASKYKWLTLKMYIDPSTPETNGWQALINRGCDSSINYTITNHQTAKPGWNTYKIDLSSSSNISSSESKTTASWTTGSITGLAIKPASESGINAKVDYIRLEDASSCQSVAIDYMATSTADGNKFNLYLDDDTDPFNGFVTKIKSEEATAGAGSTTVSLLGAAPGTYKITGFLSSDMFTLNDNPMDFSNSTDVITTAGISGLAYSGGALTGTTSSDDQQIYLKLPSDGIDTSKYRYLSLKMTRSNDGGNNPFIIYTTGGGIVAYPSDYGVGGGVYQIDLGLQGFWTGTKTDLIIRPATASGVSISLDWVALQSDGFRSTESSISANSVMSSTGSIIVNNGPTLSILEPDARGGESIRPFNMKPNEVVIAQNLREDADPSNSGESYSSYLPDVRLVEGLRGDFVKGTNIAGNGDPILYFSFPNSSSNFTFDGNKYKKACARMNIEYDQDYCLGTLGRYTAVDENGQYANSLGIAWVYDNWSSSRWSPELCVDLTTLQMESTGLTSWPSTVAGFRFDPHEFEKDTCTNGIPTGNAISVPFYVDYIKVSRTDVVRGSSFPISFQIADADAQDDPTVSFYYTTSTSPTGGTLIDTATETEGHIIWNTSGVPTGTYYIYGIVTDGRNTGYTISSGPVEISSESASSGTPPILSVSAPSDNGTVCDSMQIKGFAIESDRNEDVVVEVTADGDLVSIFKPTLYDPAAVAAYPSLDSSNAGFNRTVDISALGNGSHAIVVKAISTDSEITAQNITVTKGATCPSTVTDSNPSGAPITIDIEATPTPTPPPFTAPKVKSAKYADGKLTVTVGNVSEFGFSCNVTAYTGKNKKKVTKKFKSANNSSKATVKLAKKLASTANAKFVKVTKVCVGTSTTSSTKKVTVSK